jgi:hypothetical protein
MVNELYMLMCNRTKKPPAITLCGGGAKGEKLWGWSHQCMT